MTLCVLRSPYIVWTSFVPSSPLYMQPPNRLKTAVERCQRLTVCGYNRWSKSVLLSLFRCLTISLFIDLNKNKVKSRFLGKHIAKSPAFHRKRSPKLKRAGERSSHRQTQLIIKLRVTRLSHRQRLTCLQSHFACSMYQPYGESGIRRPHRSQPLLCQPTKKKAKKRLHKVLFLKIPSCIQ